MPAASAGPKSGSPDMSRIGDSASSVRPADEAGLMLSDLPLSLLLPTDVPFRHTGRPIQQSNRRTVHFSGLGITV